MSKIIIGVGLILIVASVVIITGCSKTTTVIIDDSPAITETVQFSKTIVPLLTQNCAGSGCHGGSVAPNLSATNAYSSLQTGNFINLAAPKSSLVYLWLTGKEAATMPMGAANNPSNINALILAWITQGAKNN